MNIAAKDQIFPNEEHAYVETFDTPTEASSFRAKKKNLMEVWNRFMPIKALDVMVKQTNEDVSKANTPNEHDEFRSSNRYA